MEIRALVFDFDGLILDTEMCEYVSISEEFDAHGVELPLHEWLDVIGRADNRPWIEWLEEVVGHPLERETVIHRRRTRHHTLISAETVRPGVVELLEEARRSGVAVAVASSSDRAWVEGHLRRLDLFEYFHAVRTRDDVARGKPHPDLFLAALDALGVAANQAIAFEDSHHGSTAAKAAGMYTVVVPNELTRHQTFDHVDLVLDSLADFPVRRYLRLPI
jgi:HAD superfamily hydrolase (TIGR01509 family)